jgi:hypothetical protein
MTDVRNDKEPLDVVALLTASIRAQNSVCVMPDWPERSATDHRAFRCTDVPR